ncbi:MAG: LytTR family transcriptional regulator [Alteromonadaceae bacterium]|nr:LytTR family transcriptional regulator [Alteromonadaceae bacterium]
MQQRSVLVFFLFPVFISTGLFVNDAGTFFPMGTVEKIIYWISVWVSLWGIAFYLSKLLLKLCKFSTIRRALCFFVAIEISVWILRLLTPLMLAIIDRRRYFEPSYYASEIGYYPTNGDRLLEFVYYSSFPVAVWMAVNYLFIWFGINLYNQPQRSSEPAEKETAPSCNQPRIIQPVFLKNNPEIDPQDILVISAEDHYVNVITEKKSTLIHFRFSDCLSEMQNIDGIRIHRSHWAKKEAIEKVERQGRKTVVTIKTGLILPVSQTYVGCLEQLN